MHGVGNPMGAELTVETRCKRAVAAGRARPWGPAWTQTRWETKKDLLQSVGEGDSRAGEAGLESVTGAVGKGWSARAQAAVLGQNSFITGEPEPSSESRSPAWTRPTHSIQDSLPYLKSPGRGFQPHVQNTSTVAPGGGVFFVQTLNGCKASAVRLAVTCLCP